MQSRLHKGFTIVEVIGAMGIFLFLFLLLSPLIKCFAQEVPKKVMMANDEASLMSALEYIRQDIRKCDQIIMLKDNELVLSVDSEDIGYKLTDDYIIRYEPYAADDPNDVEMCDWSLSWLKAELEFWPSKEEPKAVRVLAARYFKDDQPYYTFPVNHLIFLKGSQNGQQK